MDEPLNMKQALEAIESIADERLRYIARYAFMATIGAMTCQRDPVLSYAHLKHLLDGGKPAPMWEDE
jgi:hypothetical protein